MAYLDLNLKIKLQILQIKDKIKDLYDLVEILATKITIVDQEIFEKYNSLHKEQKEILKKVLDVEILEEEKDADKLLEKIGLDKNKEHSDKNIFLLFIFQMLKPLKEMEKKYGKIILMNLEKKFLKI